MIPANRAPVASRLSRQIRRPWKAEAPTMLLSRWRGGQLPICVASRVES